MYVLTTNKCITAKCKMGEKTNSKVEFNLKNTSQIHRRIYSILSTEKSQLCNDGVYCLVNAVVVSVIVIVIIITIIVIRLALHIPIDSLILIPSFAHNHAQLNCFNNGFAINSRVNLSRQMEKYLIVVLPLIARSSNLL